jgi:hypothetical protein
MGDHYGLNIWLPLAIYKAENSQTTMVARLILHRVPSLEVRDAYLAGD